uniref:Plastid phosphoglycolate phosphatase n=1 Tax=Bigelowiella natans TaxID=227086 RepID=Q5YB39_BIGNA|nr:plastid phosphoglycolate phosphatase [Bigelowiella natans]|mmetsp:Transcript_33289/g.53718  ORF Transcript_33289/g.53718 Transcript_33289/m.53718 type:complete len:406 (-) Transcript_33289:84-1301(-)|eukprot:jgi/Bigna1/86088/estExt_fgenesh1_pg.C_80057
MLMMGLLGTTRRRANAASLGFKRLGLAAIAAILTIGCLLRGSIKPGLRKVLHSRSSSSHLNRRSHHRICSAMGNAVTALNCMVNNRLCRAQDTATTTVDTQTTTPQTYQVLDPSTGPSAIEGINTIILDQDGVLWRGDRVFPSTLPSLQRFRDLGIRVLFVTNNAAKSREQYVEKWKKVGLEITKNEIVPASYMAAAYLESIKFQGKILFIGDEGTRLELQGHGFELVEVPKEATTMSNQELANFQLDSEVKAVVLAHDPNFNYRKLAIATQYLRSNEDCHFVVTNMDAGDMLDNQRFMPGTGGMADAITSTTGRVPVNTGKGGDFLLPFLMKKYGVKPSEMMCVGDRLDTDIALGRQANCKTAMPFTGVTSHGQLLQTPPEKQPTFVMDNLGVLVGLDYQLAPQ